jgi:hypothetical protein
MVVQLTLFVLPASCDSTDFEAVLQWDDGEPDLAVGSSGAAALAVWFQAPVWANSVAGIQIFVADDSQPTTWPFTARMWRPAGLWPYIPGSQTGEELASGDSYEEDTWTELRFPVPVSIENPAEFPDRVFFAGVEWETEHPLFGLDWDDPVDDVSWFFNWTEWQALTLGDVMVRAVVSDSATTAVVAGSWGRIKASYLGE